MKETELFSIDLSKQEFSSIEKKYLHRCNGIKVKNIDYGFFDPLLNQEIDFFVNSLNRLISSKDTPYSLEIDLEFLIHIDDNTQLNFDFLKYCKSLKYLTITNCNLFEIDLTPLRNCRNLFPDDTNIAVL